MNRARNTKRDKYTSSRNLSSNSRPTVFGAKLYGTKLQGSDLERNTDDISHNQETWTNYDNSGEMTSSKIYVVKETVYENYL